MDQTEGAAVLIVDGNGAVRRTIADSLRSRGFAVAMEPDGEWALETFARRRFDAVVTELRLPKMGSADLVRRLRALPGGKRGLTVIFTASPDDVDEAQEAAREVGAAAVLTQPLRAQALCVELHRELGDRYPTPPPTAEPSKSEELSLPEKLADREAEEEVTGVEKAANLSAAEGASGASIAGTLDRKPFPQVLAEIVRWKATGALMMRRDRIKKIVYFRDGRPQSVKSNLLSECLGRVMVREGMIAEAECEESLKKMKTSKRQQGTVLLEMGCINPHNLVYALSLQLRTKLFELFAWDQGDYQFNPTLLPPSEPVQLDLSPAALLYEGIRRAYSPERLRREQGKQAQQTGQAPVDNLYPAHLAHKDARADDLEGLDTEEKSLWAACSGRVTLAALRALNLLPPDDTDRLVYALVCAQQLELRGTPSEAAKGFRPPPPPLPTRKQPPKLPGAGIDARDPNVTGPITPAAEDAMGKVFAAEGKFQKGEELLRARQYKQAYQQFQEAVTLYGQEGDFHAYLGWSRFQASPKDPSALEEALAALETAVRLNPRSDKPYLFSGYIYKATGRPDRAERNFERAIQCNPDCVEALRELRLLALPGPNS